MKEGRINASAPVRIIFETEGINTSTICYAQQPGELGWCPTCKIGEKNCTKKDGLKGNVFIATLSFLLNIPMLF